MAFTDHLAHRPGALQSHDHEGDWISEVSVVLLRHNHTEAARPNQQLNAWPGITSEVREVPEPA